MAELTPTLVDEFIRTYEREGRVPLTDWEAYQLAVSWKKSSPATSAPDEREAFEAWLSTTNNSDWNCTPDDLWKGFRAGWQARARNAAPMTDLMTMARASALLHAGDHAYLPATREAANNWRPHDWVLDALMTAFQEGYKFRALGVLPPTTTTDAEKQS